MKKRTSKITYLTPKPMQMTMKLKMMTEMTPLRLIMRVKTTKTIPKKYILMIVMRKPRKKTTEPRRKLNMKTYLRKVTKVKILKNKKMMEI